MGAKYDLHSGGQGEYSRIFSPQNYNFFQKVNKLNAYNKAFHPILGLYEAWLLRAHSTHFSKLTHSTHFSVINARMKSAFIQFLVELSIDIPLLLIRHNLPC